MAQKTSASLSPKEQNVSFIAWLCSRFNMPASPLSGIAADFIKNLGVDVPFQKVDVQTKIYGIDVLLTLRNVDGKDYYVVIEVVTDERLKSRVGLIIHMRTISQSIRSEQVLILLSKRCM